MEHCDECGFVYDDVAAAEIPDRLRSLGPRYREVLETRPGERLRSHPLADTWSVIEYACHVRDVLSVQRERVQLMVREDEPTFTPMGRDERVTRDRYNEQSPSRVAMQLAEAAGALATTFGMLSEAEHERIGLYNWPTRAPRTVAWVGRHTIHEGEHHLLDVRRVLDARADP